MPSASIVELAFQSGHDDPRKARMGFEMFRLTELFARFTGPRFPDRPRRMDFHMVYVGVRGRGHVVVDFDRAPIGAGWMTFVARGRVHQWAPAEKKLEAWTLFFSPEFLQIGRRDVDALRGALLSGRAKPALALAGADRREVPLLAELIAATYARPYDALQAAELAALLRALLLRGERIATPALASPELMQLFTVLDEDVLSTRSVAHYARAVGVSPRRLGELVLAQTGRSTKQLIDERVALEVKRLLAHTNLSVKELADRAGFSEPTNFVKFFRHHAGQTPLAFRARFDHRLADRDLVGRRSRR